MSSLKYYSNDVEDKINALNIKNLGKLPWISKIPLQRNGMVAIPKKLCFSNQLISKLNDDCEVVMQPHPV